MPQPIRTRRRLADALLVVSDLASDASDEAAVSVLRATAERIMREMRNPRVSGRQAAELHRLVYGR